MVTAMGVAVFQKKTKKNLYSWKQAVGQIWPMGCSFLTPTWYIPFYWNLAITSSFCAVLFSLPSAFTCAISFDSRHPMKDVKGVELGSLKSTQVVIFSSHMACEEGRQKLKLGLLTPPVQCSFQGSVTVSGALDRCWGNLQEESDNVWDSTCGSSESIKGLCAERPGKNYLQLCYSMCGPWTSNTWELVMNEDSQALPWTYWIRTCFLTRSPGDSHAQ